MREAHVRVVIGKNFREFRKNERDSFLDAFQEISGVSRSEISGILFSPGCVIFRCRMPAEAAERLKDLFDQACSSPSSEGSEEILLVLEWAENNKIRSFQVMGEPAPGPRSPVRDHVVFVHGWSGDRKSFGDFPFYLSNSIDADIDVFQYPSFNFKGNANIYTLSRSLDVFIRNRFKGGDIAIIAHSMGGLVARKFAVQQRDLRSSIEDKIKLIELIATPSRGSSLASVANHVPFLRSHQISDMDDFSSFVGELHSQWLSWVGRENNNCAVRAIYASEDGVVPASEAMDLDREAIPILGKGHIDVIKPATAEDEIVLTTVRLLSEVGFRRKL